MPAPVSCTGCGASFLAADHLLGRQVGCPTCGAIIAVPAQTPAPTGMGSGDLQELAQFEQLATATSRPSPSSPPVKSVSSRGTKRRRKRRPTPWSKILGGGCLMVVVGVVLLLVISAIVAFNGGYQRAKRLSEGSSNFTTFTSSKYGFSASLPDNYMDGVKQQQFKDFTAPSFELVAKDDRGCLFSVDVLDLPGQQDWLGKWLSIQQEMGDQISVGDVTLDGQKAKEFHSVATIDGHTMHSFERVCQRGNLVFIVGVKTIDGTQVTHCEQAAGRMFDDFEFLTP